MSKERKFLRKCIGCGSYKGKDKLIRITKEHNSEQIYINKNNLIYGRSCYICKSINCINSAFRKMKISKILKKDIEIELKEKIITVLET